ncbi:MAG: RNA polymerase sigma factor FliA [Legionellales bacterium]
MDTLAVYSEVDQKTQEKLVHEHALLVKRIAHHLLGRLPQTVQLDDLIQAGMLGLLEATKHYDPTKGASFETYAGIRIKGHMLDEVRQNDWVPRSVHRNSRMISEAVKNVENRLGRGATDTEIATELDLPMREYQEMLQDSASSHLYGFEDLGVTDDILQGGGGSASTEPLVRVVQDDLMSRLTQVIDGLPHKEHLVLSLYYEQDLNLKEIGEVLEVSESRISQILTQATLRLKARLSD